MGFHMVYEYPSPAWRDSHRHHQHPRLSHELLVYLTGFLVGIGSMPGYRRPPISTCHQRSLKTDDMTFIRGFFVHTEQRLLEGLSLAPLLAPESFSLLMKEQQHNSTHIHKLTVLSLGHLRETVSIAMLLYV